MNIGKTDFLLALFATVLAYCVIVLGAYVRLSDAGLGCPDWPGCYGKLVPPAESLAVEQANLAYPDRPLEHPKAWKEMAHRYAAGTLGLVILLIAVKSWVRRPHEKPRQVLVPTALLALVVFQALLGMWTVTLLLKPLVVVAHLLGGMTILGLLFWHTLHSRAVPFPQRHTGASYAPWIVVALVVVVFQVALGGWTSANYAALVCTDFPRCQGQWWPQMNFAEGFTLWRGLGVDYEGGVLDGAARTAIHVGHRAGAMATFLFVGGLAALVIMTAGRALLVPGIIVLTVLLLQLSIGIANVLLLLPLPLAVAHNAGAGLLLLSLINFLHFSLAPRVKTGAGL